MYVFLVLALPLGFALLEILAYPREERPATKRAFRRGLVAFIPTLIAARLLGGLVPDMPGSVLGALDEWAGRIAPFAFLPAALYPAFYRPGERLPPGASARRLTAFYAGALAPAGLAETLRVWGDPWAYELLVWPFALAALVLAMPRVALELRASYGGRLAGVVIACLGASLALAFVPLLLLRRLWPLACALPAAALWLGCWLALPELSQVPPQQTG